MNLLILTTFKPWIGNLEERVKLPSTLDRFMFRFRSYTSDSDVIDYFERWINSKEVVELKPTWRNLFKIMKDISPELGELAYQIKVLFNGESIKIMWKSA